ncbi:MAG: GIY-YIG nuclease family protein, partial [Burkholderiales bacterium]
KPTLTPVIARRRSRRSNPESYGITVAFGLLRFARNDGITLKIVKSPAVYIVASKRNGTLYTGVTSNLSQRIWQQRQAASASFTARYGCNRLVWYEFYDTMPNAIAREKQIKAGSRKKKLSLIETMNPEWRDLYEQLI